MGNHMNKDDLQGLRFWCMKVLPTIYDDSLSYYEVLCKIGQKLNTTLANLITLGDDFDTLEADITKKLQDFLTQYRADLKAVQDEVTETLAGYDAEIKKVQQDFADFSAAVDANFAALEASIKKTLNDEIADIDAEVTAKLAAVDTEVDNKLETVQSQIDAAVSKLNSDFATLEASVNSTLTTFQTNITNQQTAFESLITGKQTTFENSVNADIAELEGKFTTLQNYVDNYFANLDVTAAVTEAVNTKIQQMIDSGEFAELFGDQIDTKLDKNNGVGTGTLQWGSSYTENQFGLGVASNVSYLIGPGGKVAIDSNRVAIVTPQATLGNLDIALPTQGQQAANKNYVDSNFLPKSNAVGSGTLQWGGNVSDINVPRLGVFDSGAYLGSSYGRFLAGQSGFTLATNDGSDYLPLSLGTPTKDRHAATKKYVDDMSFHWTVLPNTGSTKPAISANFVGSGRPTITIGSQTDFYYSFQNNSFFGIVGLGLEFATTITVSLQEVINIKISGVLPPSTPGLKLSAIPTAGNLTWTIVHGQNGFGTVSNGEIIVAVKLVNGAPSGSSAPTMDNLQLSLYILPFQFPNVSAG